MCCRSLNNYQYYSLVFLRLLIATKPTPTVRSTSHKPFRVHGWCRHLCPDGERCQVYKYTGVTVRVDGSLGAYDMRVFAGFRV